MSRLPLALHSYQHSSLHLSAQRVVNLTFEAAPPDAKFRGLLVGTPGSTLFSTVGSGAIRAVAYFKSLLCVVSGAEFYTVDSAGAATLRGAVAAGSGPAQMVSNGTQLAILSGTGATDLYVWNNTTLAQVTDADFPGATFIDYQDGYLIFVFVDSGRFGVFALNDFTSYDALDFANAEGSPDNTVAVISDHRELWLFGEHTIEIWYNSGAADFPFARNQGGFIEHGCIAPHSVAKMDNSVFWLDDNGIVQRAFSYEAKRISQHAMEEAFRGYADLSTARAWIYVDGGHSYYVLSFDEGTWVYDAATGLWAERESFGLSRWRMDCHTKAFGKHLAGDYSSGKIYHLSLDVYQENGIQIIREATSPAIHGQGAMVDFSMVEFEARFGVGLTTGQGSNPQLMLDWSDDGGHTWSNQLWRSFGAIGEYGLRCIFTRLGSARSRVFRVRISEPVPIALIAFSPDAERNV